MCLRVVILLIIRFVINVRIVEVVMVGCLRVFLGLFVKVELVFGVLGDKWNWDWGVFFGKWFILVCIIVFVLFVMVILSIWNVWLLIVFFNKCR